MSVTLQELHQRMRDHEDRLDRHGKATVEHGVRLSVVEGDVERVVDVEIPKLWKHKVSVERYIWVERIAIALLGGVIAWGIASLQQATALAGK